MSQTIPSPLWRIGQQELPDEPFAHTLARLQRLVTNTCDRDTFLTAVWPRENGYSNLGTYVIETRTPTGNPTYHFVIHYGSTSHVQRHQQPLETLLALDGFSMIVEYREHVLGVTIDPTAEQMEAFLERYRHGAQEWIAHSHTLTEMDHPWHLSDLQMLERICCFFDAAEQAQHLRGRRYARDLLAERPMPAAASLPKTRHILLSIHAQLRDQLYTIWKRQCVDYSFPPAPSIDHCQPSPLPTFCYRGTTYKKVIVFGQVAVVPIGASDAREPSPEYDLVDRESGRTINGWLPTNPGGRDGAFTYAQSLSMLLDWTQFDTLTMRQKRGVGVRVHELLLTTIQTALSESPSPDHTPR